MRTAKTERASACFEEGKKPLGGKRTDQVCQLAAEGLTDDQIAAQLKISKHTVINYWRKLRQRYQLSNRTALVVRHLKQQLEEDAAELRRGNKELVEQNGSLVVENAKLKDALLRDKSNFEIHSKTLQLTRAFLYKITPEPPYRCLYVSPSAAELGVDIEGFLSGRCSWYDVIPPEDLQRLRELGNSYPLDMSKQDCLIYRLKGDPPIWIVEIQKLYVDPSTGERCFLGLAFDASKLVDAGVIPPRVARICHP